MPRVPSQIYIRSTLNCKITEVSRKKFGSGPKIKLYTFSQYFVNFHDPSIVNKTIKINTILDEVFRKFQFNSYNSKSYW